MATKLTDRVVRDLAARESEYTVREGGGFGIRIRPTGRKTFVLIYEIDGRRRRLGLGEYPQTGLPEARTRLAEARQLLGKGQDPADTWKAEAAIEKAARARELDRIDAEAVARAAEARRVTVGAWVTRFIESYAKPRKKTWAEDERLLLREVVPVIGGRKLNEVKRSHVVALLEGIQARLRAEAEAGVTAKGRKPRRDSNGTVANRVHAVLSKMFAYAVECGEIEHNPAQHIRAAKVKEVSRDRALTDDQLAWVWKTVTGDLEGLPFGRDIADALLLMIATGQRKGELLTLRFEDIDVEGVARWAATAMKAGRAHALPLPPLALAIINRRRGLVLDPNGYVFPGARDTSKPITATAPNHSVYDWFNKCESKPPMPEWTPHDLRRTVATGLAAMGVSRVVIDRIQAHADGSTGGVYDRHSYMDEMRAALEGWNRKLSNFSTCKGNPRQL